MTHYMCPEHYKECRGLAEKLVELAGSQYVALISFLKGGKDGE